MAEVAEKLLTFEEWIAQRVDSPNELVAGRLELLSPFSPLHGFTGGRIFAVLDPYLTEHEPDAYWGIELDIPTIPYHGRRPDFVYYNTEDTARSIDYEADRATGVPTLVAEVLSDDDPDRDLVTKRREYAEAGIPHYWILDPQERTVLTLILEGDEYRSAREFGPGEVLTSDLFPGLEIPLRRLFR